MEIHDFRYPDNRKDGYGNRFVIVPLTNMVNVTVYDCFINEQGELVKLDNALIKEYTKPFIVLDDYLAETSTPELCIEFEYNGFQEIFPIVFSGMDGKLDLTGVEDEVKDISVYWFNVKKTQKINLHSHLDNEWRFTILFEDQKFKNFG